MATTSPRASRTRATTKKESLSMETSAEVVTEKKPRRFRLGWLNIFLIILLLVAFGIAGYFYYQYKYNSPEAVKAREVRSVTDTIGSVLMLPEENPTIATVTDKEKLSGQAFFQNNTSPPLSLRKPLANSHALDSIPPMPARVGFGTGWPGPSSSPFGALA